MAQSKVVSLVPAVIDWFDAIGALDSIVGCPHDWKRSSTATAIPAVTDAGNGQCVVQVAAIRALAPDVTVLSRFHGFCASSFERTSRALASTVAHSKICWFDPLTFKQVLDAVLSLARATDVLQTAMAFIAQQEEQLASTQRSFGIGRRRENPTYIRLVCLESIDPPTVAGRWLPDLAELAGALAVLSDNGGPSRPVSWDQIVMARPKQIVVLQRSTGGKDVADDVRQKLANHGIDVPTRFVSADAFVEPGPRLYDAASILIRALRSVDRAETNFREGSA